MENVEDERNEMPPTRHNKIKSLRTFSAIKFTRHRDKNPPMKRFFSAEYIQKEHTRAAITSGSQKPIIENPLLKFIHLIKYYRPNIHYGE